MKYLSFLFIVCFLISCDPCDGEETEVFEFTQEEKQIFNFPTDSNITFINQDSILISSPYKVIPSAFIEELPDDEECAGKMFEQEINSIILDSMQFLIYLQKNEAGNPEFYIANNLITNQNQTFFRCSKNSDINFLFCEPKEISKNGQTFTNVYELTHFISEAIQETILYSPDFGIEYIELSNGRTYTLQ